MKIAVEIKKKINFNEKRMFKFEKEKQTHKIKEI